MFKTLTSFAPAKKSGVTTDDLIKSATICGPARRGDANKVLKWREVRRMLQNREGAQHAQGAHGFCVRRWMGVTPDDLIEFPSGSRATRNCDTSKVRPTAQGASDATKQGRCSTCSRRSRVLHAPTNEGDDGRCDRVSCRPLAEVERGREQGAQTAQSASDAIKQGRRSRCSTRSRCNSLPVTAGDPGETNGSISCHGTICRTRCSTRATSAAAVIPGS
jgi:hypothetical protein